MCKKKYRSDLIPLQKEMKRQEEVYLVFIKRKEKTEITPFYKSSATLQQVRSARIIQRWWRKIFREEKEVEKKKESNSRVLNIISKSILCIEFDSMTVIDFFLILMDIPKIFY